MHFGENGHISVNETIAVVCHDAGGANLVFSYLLQNRPNNLKIYAKGPALQIYPEFFPELANEDSISKLLDGVDMLVTGTGWSADIEHDARKLAKS